jgi:hypothetical protein
MHPERAVHQVPAPPEVPQYRIDLPIVTSYRVTAGDVPLDIVGEQRPDRCVLTAGIEGLLGLMEPPQQSDRLDSVHDQLVRTLSAGMELLFQEAEPPRP